MMGKLGENGIVEALWRRCGDERELSARGNQKPSSEEPEIFGGAAKTTSSEGSDICSEEPGSWPFWGPIRATEHMPSMSQCMVDPDKTHRLL